MEKETTPHPLETMELIDFIKWAAGFLEGEGSFTAHWKRNGRTLGLRVTAPQKYIEPLEVLKHRFGGTIGLERNGPRQCFRWRVVGIRAVELMFTLYPLLFSRRKEQVKKILNLWKTRRLSHGHKVLCPRGHKLIKKYNNKNGWRFCRICELSRRRQRYKSQRKTHIDDLTGTLFQ